MEYRRCPRVRSDLYLDGLPLFLRGQVSIPDHPQLVRELRLLERRTARSGKDAVDHGVGGHDDYANALAGAMSLATQPPKAKICGPVVVYGPAVGSQFDAPLIAGGYGYSEYAISELDRLARGESPWD